MGEQPANSRPGTRAAAAVPAGPSATQPGFGIYRNQTTGEPFSWAVAGDVMLSMVLRLRALQELHMNILEALRANPSDADLRA
jgi:hypothetical protein